MYVIGIDGGGTNTRAAAAFLTESGLDRKAEPIKGTGSNPRTIGFRQMGEEIVYLISSLLKAHSIPVSDIGGICCGLAGAGRLDDQQRAQAELRKKLVEFGLREDVHIDVYSDAVTALEGALPGDGEGILLIAGTGSNAVGRTDTGEWFHCGGWGHLLGDEGGGYRIGLEALQAVVRAADGRASPTMLTSSLLAFYELKKPADLVSFVHEHAGKKEIAAAAPLVLEAAAKGDRAASSITDRAADELILHVQSLHHQAGIFSPQVPVTAEGALIKQAPGLKEKIKDRLQKEGLGVWSESASDPLDGALRLAAKRIYDTGKVR
ncbi:N-acetylglucosamine kinase [Alkalicoccus luteus]|uniref:ATPase n=1 Tax=Alkalicoccus luteus TaxID=1237094 RepID=A0A969PS66_9BACI|nr:BadF/BadG/BcrA/BcrD ATPase family protein [Alkalicoccus luteus]NJP38550.1 ATPase [Alkalicoccus luteus]